MALPSSIPSIVDPEQLLAWLSLPGLRILDASWYLPQSGRDAAAEYRLGHLPGAVFFDLDASSDPLSALPHTVPTERQFSTRMGALGISDDDLVVVYDGSGANVSAGRAWWMLRAFGHERVGVLDGGIRRWQALGFPIEAGEVKPPPGNFHARLNRGVLRTLDAMREVVASGAVQIVDARSQGRFEGTAAEPRPGLRGGHLPGSRNVPYQELVTAEGRLLPTGELRRRFGAAGVDLGRPIILSCGSGVSACALALALDRLGAESVSLYDGSWSEWGALPDVPVETGPAK
jgi:thiosulfate/3-mercaptopyruvate sulfurtransferase